MILRVAVMVSAVGWAKRSVPTVFVSGGHAPLCPPYHCSVPFKPPLQLPIRDPPVVFELLPLRRVDVVVDDRVAESRAQHLRFGHGLDRLAQCLRHLAQASSE